MDEIINNFSTSDDFNNNDVSNQSNSYKFVLDLDGFDGPIDLLLELAKKQKVDLSKISVLELAEQYISFIENLKKLNLEIAAEYLVMAAWIAYLKSRILLPEDEKEEISAEELSEALAFQLKRLDSIRQSGFKLFELNLLGINRHCRGIDIEENKIINFEDSTNLSDLIVSYSGVIRRNNLNSYVPKLQKLETIESALERLNKMMGKQKEWKQLYLFLPDGLNLNENIYDCSVLAATFSASLELVRKGKVELKQSMPFGDIFIRQVNKEQL